MSGMTLYKLGGVHADPTYHYGKGKTSNAQNHSGRYSGIGSMISVTSH